MINIFKNIKGRKGHDDKESFEEFSRHYLDFSKKDSDIYKKIYFFNTKYFTRKNFRIVILEQNGSSNGIQYDSHGCNSKEVSSPTSNVGNFFNLSINKDLFDTVFGLSSPSQGESNNCKIHFLKQENQIIFTLIYPNYSQILKKIRSLSHSPSLSRSSSLGDYASLNSVPLNDMGVTNLQKRVAICVSWFCNLDDDLHMKLFFRYIVHFFQLITSLSEKIAQIHQDNGTFSLDKMSKVRQVFVDSLRSLFTSPRLILPTWLSFSIMSRYTWFKEAQNLRVMKKTFLDRCVAHLLAKYHTKDKCFFLARILTVILMYHQGWVHTLSPTLHRRHGRNFSSHPGICRMTDHRQNNVNSQLGEIVLGIGGLSLSRTIIIGSNQAQVNLLLYFVSFWLRCSPLSVRHEDRPDFSQLFDLKKIMTTTRRKAASCNDPTDSGIASQEDIRRLLNTKEESRGSNSSSIHTVGIRNSSVCSSHYKSSASTGSSPVRDYNELQSKNITIDQMIAVDLAVAEFVYCRQHQGQPIEPSKLKQEKIKAMSNTKVFLVELPLLYGGNIKVEDDILYKSIFHFNIGAYIDHVVPGIALQGTSDLTIPNNNFYEDMRSWMKHSFWMYPSQRNIDKDWNMDTLTESLTDRPSSATAILLNSDKATVTICSVSMDDRPGDANSKDVISSSPIILTLLDQLQALLNTKVDSDVVFQFLETGLIHLHYLSVGLADFIRNHRILRDSIMDLPINKVILAQSLGCHSDDIPLLYSTALAHSPDIYGLEGILLY